MRYGRRGSTVYVLDASVYAPLIIKAGRKLLELTKRYRFIILDLTIYEVCNVFWKEYEKLHRISAETALKACIVARQLASKLEVCSFRDLDFKKVISIAVENNITVYDSSYITLALIINAPIATEDIDIINVAQKYKINIVRLNEVLRLIK